MCLSLSTMSTILIEIILLSSEFSFL